MGALNRHATQGEDVPTLAFNELMHMVRVRTIAPLSGGINFGVGEASTSTSPSLLTRGAEKVHPISSR